MKKEIISNNLEETKEIASELAKKILKSSKKRTGAFVIGLRGELGGGKTSFAQGFASGLNVKEKILSPTFVIIKKFKIKDEKEFENFFHIDCYRVKDEKDMEELGIREIISNPKNILLIEWAERIKKILPKDIMWIDFEFVDENKRKIAFNPLIF